MKQKPLTNKQKEIIARLDDILKDAKENDILFVYDKSDCSLTAFNAENVTDHYAGRSQEDEDDEEIDWEQTAWVENLSADYFDSGLSGFYLKFE